MPRHDLTFMNCGRPPHIRELVSYACDGSEGIIEFDGYYYINDSSDSCYSTCKSLPAKEILHVVSYSDNPPQVRYEMQPSLLPDADGTRPLVQVMHTKYEIIDDNFYLIEIYKRETIRCTNQISTIEDDDGEEMNVCFFPTDLQRLYFRVIETNPTHARFAELTTILEQEEKTRQDMFYAEQRASYRGVTIDRQTQSN
jgi:hypothetical protein